MKAFRVQNETLSIIDNWGNFKSREIVVVLHQPPYENENILYKTGWKEKDVTITEMKTQFIGEE